MGMQYCLSRKGTKEVKLAKNRQNCFILLNYWHTFLKKFLNYGPDGRHNGHQSSSAAQFRIRKVVKESQQIQHFEK
jgi:hypothetical protein